MNTNTGEKVPFIVTQKKLILDLKEMIDEDIFAIPSYPGMAEGKIVKFLKQFPWIEKLVDDSEISRVFVSGIDPRIIDHHIGGYENCTPSYESAFLLDENGEIVRNLSPEIVTSRKYFFFGPAVSRTVTRMVTGNVEKLSTIRETMVKLGEAGTEVKFIFSFDDWTRTAIVYKCPKDTDPVKWMRGEIIDPAEPVMASE